MAKSAGKPKICSVEGCGGKVLAKGFCCKHYYQFKRHGQVTDGPRRKRTECGVDSCSRPHYARGYCSKHYQQLLKKGSTGKGGSRRSAKIYCAAGQCRETVFAQGFCRKHYIKMRALQMLAEAHPERVVLTETAAQKAAENSGPGLDANISYDDQLKEAFAFVEDR